MKIFTLSLTWAVLMLSTGFIKVVQSDADKGKAGDRRKWVGTWATAPMPLKESDLPPASALSGNTVRQVIRVSIGGERLRLKFSNAFGNATLSMEDVFIAVAGDGGDVVANTQKQLKFRKRNAVELASGEELFSDPIKFNLAPGSRLAITIHFGQMPNTITGHPGSRTTSYILIGNQTSSVDFREALKIDRWYVLNGVEVLTESDGAAIAVLGNSIVDGRGTGTNKQNRWTDILSDRLLAQPTTKHLGVLNLGIGGNAVVRGGLGPTALKRFDRDILAQHGVRWLLILEGINDIGGIASEKDAEHTAKAIIDAYEVMIDRAHDKGIKVFGCTILPFAESDYDRPFRQTARDIVNNWIRNAKKFDAIIDFDKVMQSADSSREIIYGMHTGDFLHPNEKGYKRMGDAVDLDLFK